MHTTRGYSTLVPTVRCNAFDSLILEIRRFSPKQSLCSSPRFESSYKSLIPKMSLGLQKTFVLHNIYEINTKGITSYRVSFFLHPSCWFSSVLLAHSPRVPKFWQFNPWVTKCTYNPLRFSSSVKSVSAAWKRERDQDIKIEGRERECKYLNIIRRWNKIKLSSNDSSFWQYRCRAGVVRSCIIR